MFEAVDGGQSECGILGKGLLQASQSHTFLSSLYVHMMRTPRTSALQTTTPFSFIKTGRGRHVGGNTKFGTIFLQISVFSSFCFAHVHIKFPTNSFKQSVQNVNQKQAANKHNYLWKILTPLGV